MLFYHLASEPGKWKAGRTKPKRVTCQVEHKVSLVECKVTDLSLEEYAVSFPSSLCAKINLTCYVPILACWYSDYMKVAAHIDCVTIATHLRNMALRLAAIFKKGLGY